MIGPLGAKTDAGSVRKPDATLLGLFGRDLQPLAPPGRSTRLSLTILATGKAQERRMNMKF